MNTAEVMSNKNKPRGKEKKYPSRGKVLVCGFMGLILFWFVVLYILGPKLYHFLRSF
jgi:hypothetical protein